MKCNLCDPYKKLPIQFWYLLNIALTRTVYTFIKYGAYAEQTEQLKKHYAIIKYIFLYDLQLVKNWTIKICQSFLIQLLCTSSVLICVSLSSTTMINHELASCLR
jgi:hypothetical protein